MNWKKSEVTSPPKDGTIIIAMFGKDIHVVYWEVLDEGVNGWFDVILERTSDGCHVDGEPDYWEELILP